MSSTNSYRMIDLEVLNRAVCAAHSFMWEAATEHKALGRPAFENRWHGLRLKQREPRPVNRYFHIPHEGEVVFFPAWQHQRVEPHRQQRDRISIAFNLHSRELERSRYWTFRPGRLPRQWPRVHDLINGLRAGHQAPSAA